MSKHSWIAGAATLVALIGCDSPDDGDGTGTVTFTTWGEEFIEQEIPPAADGKTIIQDGYTVKYARFLLVIAEVSVGEPGKLPQAKQQNPKLFEMHAPGPKAIVAFHDLPGKPYTHVTYAISPATPNVELGEG